MTKGFHAVLLLMCVALTFTGGCNLFFDDTNTNARDIETVTTAPMDSIAWQPMQAGIEFQLLPVMLEGVPMFDMQVVRLDPTQVRFEARYAPGEARNYVEWRDSLEPEASAFINGSFFTEANIAIGLVYVDGVRYGNSFEGFGGMFQVDGNGVARVRSLVVEPYVGEVFQYAVQSFPMLIEPGGVLASTGDGFDTPSRRTVMAQGQDGMIYLMTTGLPGQISFRNLQRWLLESPLNIEIAFALDGGRSTMMYVEGENPVEVPGLAAVPVILVVY